jgi:signal transduction histidine kinase/ligand-binding sensor domain-containing protein
MADKTKTRKRKRHDVAFQTLRICLLVIVSSLHAFALDPSLDISQYAHTSWKIRDGFFKGQIRSIAQTTDGVIWLGTEFGLLRFDGVRTFAFAPPGQPLPSNDISRVLGSRDGTLWIGTANGLAAWKDGKLRTYSELSGLSVPRLLEDHSGTVWASGTGPRGKFCAIQKEQIQCRGEDGSLGRGVFGLYEDSKSRLWIQVRNGIWRWRPDPMFFSLPGTLDTIRGMTEHEDGSILVGTLTGVQRFVEGKTEPYRLPDNLQCGQVWAFLRDRGRSLWIGTATNGIVHLHQGRAEAFTQADGLSGDSIWDFFEDREGSIWVITSAGLDRFRDVPVATFSRKQGLVGQQNTSVLTGRDGSVWFATRNGPEQWKNGRLVLYRKAGNPPLSPPIPSVREVQAPGLPSELLLAMYEDDRGRIWFGTSGGVAYLDGGRFVPVTGVPEGVVHNIAETSTGDFWIDHQDAGLFHFVANKVVEQIPWAKLGLSRPPRSLISDRARTGLWLGLSEDGLAYYADHQIRKSYGTADGLGTGRVGHLRLDAEGTLWASTQGGLSRLGKERFATLGAKNGLPCDAVHWSIEDNEAALWLYMSCGLVRIDGQEWHEWVAAANSGNDATKTIKTRVFDSSDGIRLTNLLGTYSPFVTKAADGRLWFSNADGINMVDPRHLPFNAIPPPVRIEQITADRKPYDRELQAGSLSLPARIRDLQIDYTAYSFVAPEKVRFRYKLEPHDRDWQDVGNRRQAFYTDLPPGNYKFRVAAANDSGVWNEAGASFDFSVAPAYYQTLWFRLLVVAVLLGLAVLAYQLRLRQIRRQFNVRLDERVAERTRIARDLHDTLLQSFQGVLMKFHAMTFMLDDRPEAQKVMEGVITQARRAIVEGREAVQGLRASTVVTNDLAPSIKALGDDLAATHPCDFRVTVDGEAKNLVPLLRDEVYKIAGEALRNAFHHSQAKQIDVEIRYEERVFRMRIRDDGKGMDPKVTAGTGREGHYGLPGMRERAKLAGGKLAVLSEVDSGTEIELTIPASFAYAKASAARSGEASLED